MAIDPITAGALGGAGLGVLKNIFGGNGGQKRRAAAIAAFQPFTGAPIPEVQDENLFGDIFKGAVSGASFGQGLGLMQSNTDLNNAFVSFLQGKTSPAGGPAPEAPITGGAAGSRVIRRARPAPAPAAPAVSEPAGAAYPRPMNGRNAMVDFLRGGSYA